MDFSLCLGHHFNIWLKVQKCVYGYMPHRILPFFILIINSILTKLFDTFQPQRIYHEPNFSSRAVKILKLDEISELNPSEIHISYSHAPQNSTQEKC